MVCLLLQVFWFFFLNNCASSLRVSSWAPWTKKKRNCFIDLFSGRKIKPFFFVVLLISFATVLFIYIPISQDLMATMHLKSLTRKFFVVTSTTELRKTYPVPNTRRMFFPMHGISNLSRPSHVETVTSVMSNQKAAAVSHVETGTSALPNQKTAGSKHDSMPKGAKLPSSTPPRYNHTIDTRFQEILRWKGATLRKGFPQWQRLDNHFGAFLYGAHFNDVDFPPRICVVGIALSQLPYQNVTCYFYDRHDGPIRRNVSGRLYHFRSRNGYAYIGAFVDCPIPSGSDRSNLPFALSVSKERETEVTNYLIVHYSHNVTLYLRQQGYYSPTTVKNKSSSENHHLHQQHPPSPPPPSSPWKYNVTRCFPAIHKSYNNHQLLAEMVAASRAMGVQRFVFYVKQAGPQVLRLLQVLESEGLAEVYPWNLLMRGDRKGVYYAAQFSSIQDCLYRHLGTSRYILFGDMDELFVPRLQRSLLPLLNQQFDKKPSCGTFLFRNVFFNLNLKGKPPPPKVDPSGFSRAQKLIMLSHVTRESAPWPIRQRSKLAVVPDKVISVAAHIVLDFRLGYKHCEMDPRLGLLYHYRVFNRPNAKHVNDTRLYSYAEDIIKGVRLLLHGVNMTVSKPYP